MVLSDIFHSSGESFWRATYQFYVYKIFLQVVDSTVDPPIISEYSDIITIIQIKSIVVTICGFIGNIFTYMTVDKFPQKTSGQTFIKCLAVADFLAAFQDGIIESLLPLIGLNLMTISDLVCRFFGWWTFVTSIFGNFMIHFCKKYLKYL